MSKEAKDVFTQRVPNENPMIKIKPCDCVDVDGYRVGWVRPNNRREGVTEEKESERDDDVEDHGGDRNDTSE